jgi:hypothetical protein
MPNNVGILTAGPEQIEATWKAFTPAVLDAMIKTYTTKQIADAEWKVAHGEWTSIYSAQVSLSLMFIETHVLIRHSWLLGSSLVWPL